MSNKALSYIFEHSKTKGSARVLMLAIADMANDEGECWPGKARLEKKINVTLRNVIKLVQECERMGELAVIERPDATNRYVIVGLAKDDRLKGARSPRDKWTPAEKVDTDVKLDTTVTGDTPTTVIGDSTPLVSPVTPNLLSSNPHSNPQKNNTPLPPPTPHIDVPEPPPAPPIVAEAVKTDPPPKAFDFDSLSPEEKQAHIDKLTALTGILVDAEGRKKDRDAARIELNALKTAVAS